MKINTPANKLYVPSFAKRGVYFLFEKLIKPKSADDDVARREFILNILLSSSIILLFSALIAVIKNFLIYGSAYEGTHPLYLFSVNLFLIALLFFSRRGFLKTTSYLLIGAYFSIIFYGLCRFGIDQPQILLGLALIIVMAGILTGSHSSLAITLLSIATLLTLGFLQLAGKIIPHDYWKTEAIIKQEDPVIFSITLGVIAIVSWLSNRELKRALRQAKKSEEELKLERDLLETKVEERTEELKLAQEEKARQMYRMAETGQMTLGVFHDLANPLTTAILEIEQTKIKHHAIGGVKIMDNLLKNLNQIRSFVEGARRQVQNQEIITDFYLADEINLAIHAFSYKAQKESVQIIFRQPRISAQCHGNPVKFCRMIGDIISNAIDSYEKNTGIDRRVTVSLYKNKREISIVIRDQGCGIKKENMEKIFQPLFTTKGIKGTGLGLSICKKIIEEDFNGRIKFKSREGSGSVFILTIPYQFENNVRNETRKQT